MTRSMTITLLAVAVLSISACDGSASSAPEIADVPAGADVQAAPTGAWVLDVAQSDLEFPSNSTATMLVSDDGTLSGASPCNDWGGQAAVAADGSWSLRELGATDAGCDEGAEEAQDTFFAALQAATSWERTGESTLVLVSGSDVLTFRADEPLDTDVLLGTTWEVATIETNDESRPIPGDVPTPTFTYTGDALRGTFHQHTGCREATGDWVARGGQVAHTAWSQVGDADVFEDCSEDQAATEQAVQAAVAGGFRLEVGDAQVVFRSARDTRNAVVLRPAAEG
jgi:heat shock protein HslJ